MTSRPQTQVLEDGTVSRQFSQDLGTTTGLTFGYRGGYVVDHVTVTTIPDGTLTLTDDATNEIYIDVSATPVVAVAASLPANNYVPCCTVVTASGVISSVTDLRTRAAGWNVPV